MKNWNSINIIFFFDSKFVQLSAGGMRGHTLYTRLCSCWNKNTNHIKKQNPVKMRQGKIQIIVCTFFSTLSNIIEIQRKLRFG
jgi:hypothetical protein